MKNSSFFSLLLGLLSIQALVAQDSTTLTVDIEGCKSDQGKMYVALYAGPSEWLDKSYKGEIAEIQDGRSSVTFQAVPHGTYAISTFHDKNLNGKLDSGIFGIPTEPYASSRGAKGRFGPPKWEDAKFTLSEPSHTEVIKY